MRMRMKCTKELYGLNFKFMLLVERGEIVFRIRPMR